MSKRRKDGRAEAAEAGAAEAGAAEAGAGAESEAGAVAAAASVAAETGAAETGGDTVPAPLPAEAAPDAPATDPEADQAAAPAIDPQHLRLAEALLFASAEPVGEAALARHLPEGADLGAILAALQALYAGRGVELVAMGERWQFRTAPDLAPVLARTIEQPRRLSRAAVETLAVIAYHQPVTRAEIEEIRGVAVGQGTIDILFEADFIRPRGRRQTPGKPVTWGTSEQFLTHFGLGSLNELPNLAELKAAGLLDKRPAVTAYAERAGLLPRSEEREAALATAPPGEAAEDAAEAEQFQPLAAEDGAGAGKTGADTAKGGM